MADALREASIPEQPTEIRAVVCFFFQAEDGIRYLIVTGVQTCALPISGILGTAIFVTYLVPQTLLFIPLAEIIRDYRIGDTPWALILTYPTFLIPFCTWLMKIGRASCRERV